MFRATLAAGTHGRCTGMPRVLTGDGPFIGSRAALFSLSGAALAAQSRQRRSQQHQRGQNAPDNPAQSHVSYYTPGGDFWMPGIASKKTAEPHP